jgi:hypothetical protein
LDVAIGFAPHKVYSVSLPGWQPSNHQQQQQQGWVAGAAGSNCSDAAGVAAALMRAVGAVQASRAGLGVYGAVLVMHAGPHSTFGGTGLQLLLGCYG